MNFSRLRASFSLWAGLVLTNSFAATAPAWWLQWGVVQPGAVANDYAAANIGQVKRIAALAAAEMQVKLPGGAGPRPVALVVSWALPPTPGVARQDYAAITVGQLKALAQLFYARLAEVKYAGAPLAPGQVYPWNTNTSDEADYAIANIGQVKYLFSFDPAHVDVTPPVIASLTATPSVISPPNRRMVPVTLTAVVKDAGDPSPVTRILSVSWRESANAPANKGKPADDYVLTGAMMLDLRAEVVGPADRVYSIVVESRDHSNNATTRVVTVTVQRKH